MSEFKKVVNLLTEREREHPSVERSERFSANRVFSGKEERVLRNDGAFLYSLCAEKTLRQSEYGEAERVWKFMV